MLGAPRGFLPCLVLLSCVPFQPHPTLGGPLGQTPEIESQGWELKTAPSHLPPSSPRSLSPYHLCQLVDGRAQRVDSALVPRVCTAQERGQLPELRMSARRWLLGTRGWGRPPSGLVSGTFFLARGSPGQTARTLNPLGPQFLCHVKRIRFTPSGKLEYLRLRATCPGH